MRARNSFLPEAIRPQGNTMQVSTALQPSAAAKYAKWCSIRLQALIGGVGARHTMQELLGSGLTACCHWHEYGAKKNSAHLIHGVYKPLGVWGKALCQLANALRHLSLLTVVRGRAQVVQQLLCDDLQAKIGACHTRLPPLHRPSHWGSGA